MDLTLFVFFLLLLLFLPQSCIAKINSLDSIQYVQNTCSVFRPPGGRCIFRAISVRSPAPALSRLPFHFTGSIKSPRVQNFRRLAISFLFKTRLLSANQLLQIYPKNSWESRPDPGQIPKTTRSYFLLFTLCMRTTYCIS